MASHRSTTPLVICGFGIAAVFLFGGIVWKTTESTPILKLKPLLEKKYNARGFHCYIKVEERRIEIRPPQQVPEDRISRRRLAATALAEYLELTKDKGTLVEGCIVLPAKGSKVAPEEVTRGQYEQYLEVNGRRDEIARKASIASSTSATVVDLAPGYVGAAVYVTVPPGARWESANLAGREVAKGPMVGFVHVARSDGSAFETGPDIAALASTTPGALK